MQITKDIEIEDLVEELPEAVSYLREEGIRCLRCGEPIWGSLEDAAKEKGFDDEKIERFVKELNQMNQSSN
jgi:iron-sulfur cluster repair protein YtfE (RIC family)